MCFNQNNPRKKPLACHLKKKEKIFQNRVTMSAPFIICAWICFELCKMLAKNSTTASPLDLSICSLWNKSKRSFLKKNGDRRLAKMQGKQKKKTSLWIPHSWWFVDVPAVYPCLVKKPTSRHPDIPTSIPPSWFVAPMVLFMVDIKAMAFAAEFVHDAMVIVEIQAAARWDQPGAGNSSSCAPGLTKRCSGCSTWCPTLGKIWGDHVAQITCLYKFWGYCGGYNGIIAYYSQLDVLSDVAKDETELSFQIGKKVASSPFLQYPIQCCHLDVWSYIPCHACKQRDRDRWEQLLAPFSLWSSS